jgi:hypothetical protein
MTRSMKPTVAGILDIIAGVTGLIGAGVLFALAGAFRWGGFMPPHGPNLPSFLTGGLFMVLGASHLIFGVLAVVGGLFALQRRRWGWALAGGIGAVFASFVLGVPAIIITALSEGDFAAPREFGADANTRERFPNTP